MRNSTPPAIIGAGISGLTVAYHLVRAGLQPAIYEPGPIGGVIRTTHLDGFTLESGPNVLLGKEALKNLILDLGLEDQLVRPTTLKYKQLVWHNGKAAIVPKNPLQLVRTSLLSTGAKLRLPFVLSKKSLIAQGTNDLSVFELFSKILGESGVINLLDPALRGIVGGDLKSLSARSLFEPIWNELSSDGTILSFIKKKRSGPRKEIFVLKNGMEQLTNALMKNINSSVSIEKARVAVLSKNASTFEIKTAEGKIYSHSHIYVATSGQDTASFISELCPNVSTYLRELKFAGIVVIHAAVNEPSKITKDSFGVLFPHRAPTQLMGVMYNSTLFPHLAPPGKALLTICLGGVNQNQVLEYSDEELKEIAVADVNKLLHIDISKILKIQRWKRAIPQYTLGHWNLVKLLKQYEDQLPGLYFCGADIGGVGVPDRVAVANEAVLRSIAIAKR